MVLVFLMNINKHLDLYIQKNPINPNGNKYIELLSKLSKSITRINKRPMRTIDHLYIFFKLCSGLINIDI